MSSPSYNYSSPEENIEELQKLLKEKEEKIQELESGLEEAKKTRKIYIPKDQLGDLVRRNWSNKKIANHFDVSVSTIKRRVREYDLTGIRKPGRKPKEEKPETPEIEKEENWISVEKYIRNLDEEYDFIEKRTPTTQYINPETLVCSNEKKNPEGEYTTVGIYFICIQSDVYFINYTRFKYSETPTKFQEIYNWAEQNAFDSLEVRFAHTSFTIIKPIAYTFLSPQKKPEVIRAGRE